MLIFCPQTRALTALRKEVDQLKEDGERERETLAAKSIARNEVAVRLSLNGSMIFRCPQNDQKIIGADGSFVFVWYKYRKQCSPVSELGDIISKSSK